MHKLGLLFSFILFGGGVFSPASALDYEEYPSIRLRSLDKITARTITFDAQVGSTIKFGDIYIKIQSCRKPPPVEKTEAAAFLQIWQIDKTRVESKWIFSGWMFSSSPALSGMSHPVYDVWVIDCLGKDPEELPPEETKQDDVLPDEGTVPEGSVNQPGVAPEEQKPEPKTDIKPQDADTPLDLPLSQGDDHDTDAPADDQSTPATQEPTSPAPDAPKSKESIEGIY
jgi:hypothetical protein